MNNSHMTVVLIQDTMKMHIAALTVTIFSTALVASAVPVAASAPNWTITNFTRTCNAPDTTCAYTFGIDTNDETTVIKCTDTVKGAPASHTSTRATCGNYTVSSNWSGQFGKGKGTKCYID